MLVVKSLKFDMSRAQNVYMRVVFAFILPINCVRGIVKLPTLAPK